MSKNGIIIAANHNKALKVTKKKQKTNQSRNSIDWMPKMSCYLYNSTYA